MNLFQRITASFSGSMESVVSQFENHEAIVEAALKDTRAMAAKAKVRLSRVQQDGRALETKLQNMISAEQSWKERAIKFADTDEEKAMECVRRKNACQQQHEELQKSIEEHCQQEKQLAKSVEKIEAKVREFESTRNMLRSRQSTANAQRVIHRLESNSGNQLDDVLERWEMKILETEYYSPCESAVDMFEADFKDQENTEALKIELESLKQEKNNDSE